jgi:mono/diheme cytochrome c family protein
MLLPWLLNLLMVGDPPDEQLAFFESRIRPVLAEHCYECHNSSGRAEGGLAIDHRAGLLQGGDRGSIVVPGRPQDSRLLAVLRHEIADLKMPEGGPKLSDEIAADFASWITEGAFDPRDAPPSAQQLAETTSWDAVFARRSTWCGLSSHRRFRLTAGLLIRSIASFMRACSRKVCSPRLVPTNPRCCDGPPLC